MNELELIKHIFYDVRSSVNDCKEAKIVLGKVSSLFCGRKDLPSDDETNALFDYIELEYSLYNSQTPHLTSPRTERK